MVSGYTDTEIGLSAPCMRPETVGQKTTQEKEKDWVSIQPNTGFKTIAIKFCNWVLKKGCIAASTLDKRKLNPEAFMTQMILVPIAKTNRL